MITTAYRYIGCQHIVILNSTTWTPEVHRELIPDEMFRKREELTLGMQILAGVVLKLDLLILRLRLHICQTLSLLGAEVHRVSQGQTASTCAD